MYGRMQDQLQSQVTAAKGGKLEWHFAEQARMEQFQKHLRGSDEGKELLSFFTSCPQRFAPTGRRAFEALTVYTDKRSYKDTQLFIPTSARLPVDAGVFVCRDCVVPPLLLS